tara:strand:+ start:4646 stop:4987 length:342 start_codon:yes stop_codon:yes gene_type:complete
MALGNANTAAQARGKNPAVKIKKFKERNPDAFSFLASTLQSSPACSLKVHLVTNTLYHNGANALPAFGDLVYTALPLVSSNLSPNGSYKILVSGTYYNIDTDNNGLIRRIDAC